MIPTTVDFRVSHPADAPLEYTGHEALAEQFRAALKGDRRVPGAEKNSIPTEDQAQ